MGEVKNKLFELIDLSIYFRKLLFILYFERTNLVEIMAQTLAPSAS